MVCLRCGHCCKSMLVMIVKDPSKGIVEGNIIDKPEGTCPHLVGNTPGKYKCAIHKKKWFSDTPCFAFSQIEKGNTPCRLGEYHLKRSMSNKKG